MTVSVHCHAPTAAESRRLQPRPLRGSNSGRRRLLCAGQACSKFDMIQNETTTQYIGLRYIPSDDVNQVVGPSLSLLLMYSDAYRIITDCTRNIAHWFQHLSHSLFANCPKSTALDSIWSYKAAPGWVCRNMFPLSFRRRGGNKIVNCQSLIEVQRGAVIPKQDIPLEGHREIPLVPVVIMDVTKQ